MDCRQAVSLRCCEAQTKGESKDCRQAVSLCCFEEGLSLVSEDPNICRTQPSYLTHSSNGPL